MFLVSFARPAPSIVGSSAKPRVHPAQRSNGKATIEVPVNVIETPDLLDQPTYDPMSGKTLHYRAAADGGFLLYSVGVDGIDDGGNPTANASTNRFGFWDGRDAVWPVPVQPTQLSN